MDTSKRQKLASKGFAVGDAADFLGLSTAEAAFIELRLDFSGLLSTQRKKRRWTQTRLAKAIGSSQSRVAKMEAADPGVSVDLMLRALLEMGVGREEIGRVLCAETDTSPV